ncbi:MAG: transcription-repair coupling factor, partial [Acidobacteriota bacterium]
MRELTPSADEIAQWNEQAHRRWSEVRFAERLSELFQFTENGELFNGFEFLFPLVMPLSSTLFDYLAGRQQELVLVLSEPEELLSIVEDRWEKARQGYQDCDLEGIPALPPASLYLDWSRVEGWFEAFPTYRVEVLSSHPEEAERFDFRPVASYRGRIQDVLKEIDQSRRADEQVIFVMHTEGMMERLAEVFREYEAGITVARSGFQEALLHPVAVTVGKLESEQIGVGDQNGEFVILEYAGGARLYVPVDRLDLIQKYASGTGAAPQIDRLGGTSWKKTKARIKKSMQHLAEELLKLYARREVARGHAFAPDDEMTREFDASFEYEETPDQAAAISACKHDMESEKPMDRLVCGDVGYGKTEVAMRAAFKAVNDGKQVALLAPTTVLAFQHYNTFQERFKGFPVKIGMLSRFVPRAAQKEVLAEAAGGTVDILIGTHRLLSRDVSFSDLGLIIVDEEQRFGVAQKERLKQLKAQIDVLTLSATPIPRTLNMSLVGIRDLSIIETAPKDRLAIQTVVVRFSHQIIESAIDLELKRNGQVFFLHNRVETIHAIAQKLSRIVPRARIGVAHGQMREDELEQVMLAFLRYEYDVLVCTTIIENGLDIPRANTIVVNRADRFGLSELYQLRGRVGRSNRRAYAYLLVGDEGALSEDARKRLAAIKEFSDLGSGFRLAALDLEIRGAGNLLGGEQSGHIDAVGFELYVKLLEQAIRELKGEPETAKVHTTVDLRLDIQIPEHYIDDPNTRLWLYKRLSTVSEESRLDGLRDEVIDRFGRYPRAVANLFEYGKLRLIAERLKVTSIERKGSQVRLSFRDDTPLTPEMAVRLVQTRAGLNFSADGSLLASIDIPACRRVAVTEDSPTPRPQQQVIAVLNGEEVYARDFRRFLDFAQGELTEDPSPIPTRELFSDFITNRLLLQEAKKQGLTVGEDELRQYVAQWTPRDGSAGSSLKDDVYDYLLAQKLLKKEALGNLEVTLRELQVYYEQHADEFRVGD